jgi:TolB protein
MTEKTAVVVLALTCCWFAAHGSLKSGANVAATGLFEDQADVGRVLRPGTLDYDPTRGTYTVSGNCENVSSAADALHFVWKKVTGDVSLSADISLLGKPADEHQEAVLMIRQSLDADSAYADAALRGNGLAALHYRDEKGAATHQIQTHEVEPGNAEPKRVRIEKRANFVYLFLGDTGKELHYSGASAQILLQGTYYVGIGFCSQSKAATDKAIFANVDLKADLAPATKVTLYSTLERVTIASTSRQVVYVAPERFEAPN